VKPSGHEQVPEIVHTPAPEQAGEQAEDCMSSRVRLPLLNDNWETSGTASHRIIRSLEFPFDTAIQVFDARERDFAESGVEELTTREVGSSENAAEPA
jgi:hypothetical protein